MPNLIDFDAVNQAALGRARPLLQDLIPGGKFRSLEYVVRNPRRDDQQPGSFKINYRTAVWKDFASGDGGGDFISLAAYIWDCTQADAARRLADKLGVPTAKAGSAKAREPIPRKEAQPLPKIQTCGNEGPSVRGDEIRRHIYRDSSGTPVKIKIKYASRQYVIWYRVFEEGKPAGWQAKKPGTFTAVPYVPEALNPFDPPT
jgi:hypothetical protein